MAQPMGGGNVLHGSHDMAVMSLEKYWSGLSYWNRELCWSALVVGGHSCVILFHQGHSLWSMFVIVGVSRIRQVKVSVSYPW